MNFLLCFTIQKVITTENIPELLMMLCVNGRNYALAIKQQLDTDNENECKLSLDPGFYKNKTKVLEFYRTQINTHYASELNDFIVIMNAHFAAIEEITTALDLLKSRK